MLFRSHEICMHFSITEIPLEKLSAMPALKQINMKANPLDKDTIIAIQSPQRYEILSTADI